MVNKMIDFIKNLYFRVKFYFTQKKKLKELRKKDPFIYH